MTCFTVGVQLLALEIVTHVRTGSRRHVPRYLFRAFSDKSRGGIGLNNFEEILPDDTNWSSPQNAGEAGTRRMLEEHLLWHYDHPSAFTSWSSSLLWVIRHALAKKYIREEDVYICILDTSNYGIPVYPATALYDAYSLTPRPTSRYVQPDLSRHYYYREDLLHGPIYSETAKFEVVCLDELEAEGMYRLLPELASDSERRRDGLARTVRDTRDRLSSPSLLPSQVRQWHPENTRFAKKLGSCFGDAFVFPVAAAFLSLRRWNAGQSSQNGIDDILNALRDYPTPENLGGEENFGDDTADYERYKPREALFLRTLLEQLRNRNAERKIEHEAEREAQILMGHLSCESYSLQAQVCARLIYL